MTLQWVVMETTFNIDFQPTRDSTPRALQAEFSSIDTV